MSPFASHRAMRFTSFVVDASRECGIARTPRAHRRRARPIASLARESERRRATDEVKNVPTFPSDGARSRTTNVGRSPITPMRVTSDDREERSRSCVRIALDGKANATRFARHRWTPEEKIQEIYIDRIDSIARARSRSRRRPQSSVSSRDRFDSIASRRIDRVGLISN